MTPRQLETLQFISSYIHSRGIAPNYDEIADGINICSKSGVTLLTRALIEQGYLDVVRLESGQMATRGLRLTSKPLPGSEDFALDVAIEICRKNGYEVYKNDGSTIGATKSDQPGTKVLLDQKKA